MKHLVILLLSGALLSWTCSAKSIRLAEDGKPLATIVTPAKTPEKIRTAALDLQRYVEKICGVKIPIHEDGRQVAGTGLYIGDCEGAPACTLAKTGANWEGYVIEEKDGSLYFTGLNPSPVAYGVYSFIEDDLGVRWFAPGDLWEKVPTSAKPGTLAVAARPRTVIPHISPRVWSAHNWAPMWDEWNIRNKTAPSEVISMRNFQNRIHLIFPVDKYAKEHPEYYPLMENGKRYIPRKDDRHWRPCESNPEVQKIVVDYIREYFDKNPTQDSFSVGMDDISHLCCCPNCRAMDDAPDSYEQWRFSDRHYKFVNIIAKEIGKTHPGKFIGTLIYSIALQPPKQVPVMEPNVFGYITETSAAWWMPGQRKIDHDLTAEWHRRVKHLFRYDYYGFASMAPRYYPHYVDEQMKFDHAHGVEGMYIETYTFLPLTMPMFWQFAKLEWDTSLDTDRLLDEFMTIYGPAKPQMALFWDLLENSYQVERPGRGKWEHREIINQALAISPEDLDKGFALLDEADKAAGNDDKVKARIAIHRDALTLAAYAVRPYAFNEQIQVIDVNTQADADKVFALVAKLDQCKAGREEYVESLKRRDDMIGLNIRGLLGHNDYMPLGSFAELETNAMTALFQALAWYAVNRPADLKTISERFDNPALKSLVDGYLRLMTSDHPPRNLMCNGDFEITDVEKNVSKEMIDWDNEGCPMGWKSWARDSVNVQVVPEGRSGNAVKISRNMAGGCLIQTVNAEAGGVYLLTAYMKLVGGGNASLGIRYRTKEGRWCKPRIGEISARVTARADGDWTRVLLLVEVPKGVEASQITVMPGFDHLIVDSTLLMDDFSLIRVK
ncbi:MAG: DUF4838 domain-containing protein [Victivallales bacterium]|nr:DUF4838 domain-containing protein [Victivallales bacterium]